MSETYMVLTTWERGVATGMRWVETREAAKFSVMSRLVPAARSYPSRTVRGAEVENPGWSVHVETSAEQVLGVGSRGDEGRQEDDF